METLTIITTFPPLLVAWVAAIAFFVTLALVAIISKGRRWYELGCIFVLVFLAISLTGLLSTQLLFGIHLFHFEMISLK